MDSVSWNPSSGAHTHSIPTPIHSHGGIVPHSSKTYIDSGITATSGVSAEKLVSSIWDNVKK